MDKFIGAKMEKKYGYIITTNALSRIPLVICMLVISILQKNVKVTALNLSHTRCDGNDCVCLSEGDNSTATALGFNSSSVTFGNNSVSRCYGAFCFARCNNGDSNVKSNGICLAQGYGRGSTAVCNTTKCYTVTNGVISSSSCSGDRCNSICKQEYCRSECFGYNCSAMCTGRRCYAACHARDCTTTCEGNSCEFNNNDGSGFGPLDYI